MKEKKISKYDWSLKELSEAKKLVVTCIELYKKFPKHLVKDINFTGEDLNNVIKKIEIREQIIQIIQNNEELSSDRKNLLINLYRDYSKSNYYEKDDLKELSSLIGEDLIEKEDIKKYANNNYEKEFDKATYFNIWINEKIGQNNINHSEFCSIMAKILTDYPYCEKAEIEKMWDEFGNFKQNRSYNKYLLKVKGHYQNLLNNGQLSDEDIKKDIYNAILIFLNRF